MFHVLKRFLALNLRDSLPLLGIYIVSLALSVALVAILVWMPKAVIDAVSAGADTRAYRLVLVLAAATALIFGLETLLKPVQERMEILVRTRAENKLNMKIMSLSYEYLEDPSFLDLKERATFPLRNQDAILTTFNTIQQLVRSIVILVGLTGLLLRVSVWLVAGILLLGGINVFIMVNSSRYIQEFFKRLIPSNRKFGYYFSAMQEPLHQKDIRLFNMSGLLVRTVQHFNRISCDYFQEMNKYMGKRVGFQELIGTGQAALSFFAIGKRVLSRVLSVGDFSMYISASLNFGSELSSLVFNFGRFLPVLGYLEPYLEVMDMEDVIYHGSEQIDSIGTLEFRKVSFAYPRSDKDVLHDISFTFHPGEKISLVGPNGAGKTTLVKLICGLYRPTRGEILVDGRPLSEIDLTFYRRALSAVFQDFRFFPLSLGKNLTGEAIDPSRLDEALAKVEMKDYVENLTYGLETVVGRSYDKQKGRDFSGGQLQKLVIARALYKGGDLIILDEPTAALDPLAEAEIYEHFNTLVGDRSALYISHRMSSSRFCDRVLVIDQGRIIEEGTHDSLCLIPDGMYRRLYETQAGYYKTKQAMRAAEV